MDLAASDIVTEYEELAEIFQEKYGMDVSINVDALVKDYNQELSRLAAVIVDSNIQVKLNIQASRELETLKKIKSFNLPESFDYATSSWCFRHLTDPVGTLVQTHNILNPKGGMLHADGFLSKVKLGDKEMGLTSTMRIVLHSMEMPYIFDPKDNQVRRAGGYILTRNNPEELSLNYQHLEVERTERYGIDCELISAIDLKADVEVLKQELFSKNGYRSSLYEDKEMALNGSALEKYNYSLGTERYFATEPKYFVTGVVVKSAETALLLGKLKLEGINVGTNKISAKQYEALFNFIKQEYPDLNAIKQDDTNRELIIQYMVYDIVKNTSSKTLEAAFSTYPDFNYIDYINEHCLFLATINGNTDLFSEIHGILNEPNLDGGSNIDLSKMYLDTLKLIDNYLKNNDYQSIKTRLSFYKENEKMGEALLSMAFEYSIRNGGYISKNKVIHAIISELGIKLTREHIQQYFNNSRVTKGNNIIQSGFATMDDFVSIGDIQKIDALTSYDAEYAYKNTGQKFAELKEYDTEKIKFMTSREVRTIVNDRKYVDIKLIGAMYDQDKYFTQFIVGLYDAEQQKLILESDIVRNHFGNNPFSENKFNLLNKIKQDFRMEKLEWVDFVNFSEKKLELLSSDSFKKLLKDKKVTFEELSALPEDKLEAMSRENIILLILNREASLPFKAISELRAAEINTIAKTSSFTSLMAAPKAEFDEIVGKTELSGLKKIAIALRGQIAERTQASPAEKKPTSPNVNSRRGSLDLR